ncbi:TPA: hypothetical protein HA338_02500 [Methanosarcina acetivorans]|uniref:Uncharacterized protein n=1 Tax=Methanosarcina acetivorans TaxID=2214 RepID=A0A832S928_9EURY|nr:hypothetical protein [Methanosarcina acetivorans]
MIIGSCVGCIGQESTGNSSKTSNDSTDASVSEDVGNLSINFSAIPVLPPYNESESEWLKTNASHVAQIALNDSRAKQMTREGATIVGVVYSCHPTPEGYAGSGCAPALRIRSENRIVDFLVDEEEGIVVETVTEITSNSKFPGEWFQI